jgi:single-strand DNA-binding protein
MANLNKVTLIGRLTRDPEIKSFSNGGKVANVGFAVNNRKKNQQSGQWEDVPVWLDLKAFNRETGRKLADQIETVKKGQQIYVEGHLVLEEWTGKDDGAKKSKLVIYVDDFQYLEKREGAGAGAGSRGKSSDETIEDVPF